MTELLNRQLEADKRDEKEEKDQDVYGGENQRKQIEQLRRMAERVR